MRKCLVLSAVMVCAWLGVWTPLQAEAARAPVVPLYYSGTIDGDRIISGTFGMTVRGKRVTGLIMLDESDEPDGLMFKFTGTVATDGSVTGRARVNGSSAVIAGQLNPSTGDYTGTWTSTGRDSNGDPLVLGGTWSASPVTLPTQVGTISLTVQGTRVRASMGIIPGTLDDCTGYAKFVSRGMVTGAWAFGSWITDSSAPDIDAFADSDFGTFEIQGDPNSRGTGTQGVVIQAGIVVGSWSAKNL